MRHIFLALLLALAIAASSVSGAHAATTNDVTVFPPSSQENCTGQTGYLGWDTGSNSTSCNSGQQILSRTLGCGANQYVTFDGAHYTCKTVPSCQSSQYLSFDGTNFQCYTLPSAPPTCGANQFLSFNGSAYECKDTGIPACGNNQVLTYNGTNFYCVARTDSMPTCGSDQFLTYNGNGFQCATVTTPAYPTCGTGQVVTSNGSTLTCATLPSATTVPTCAAGQVLTADGNSFTCTTAAAIPTCTDGQLVVYSGGVPTCKGLSQATTTTITTEFAFQDPSTYANYLDCPAGMLNVGCSSVAVPSGKLSCAVTPGVEDPVTHLSSCAQAGCGSTGVEGDRGYFTAASCIGF
ncbi:MAG TPA: hypothetical protein VHB73_03455 [Alphaproteobacteria bacterium]|nr:hypothetical protein [Alphaproteobacteria bacterium]